MHALSAKCHRTLRLFLMASILGSTAGGPSVASSANPIELRTVTAEPLPCGVNLLSNAGFEQTAANGTPTGWQWHQGKTDAKCIVDPTVSHRGRQSIKLTSNTTEAPNVFGMLWRPRPARLVEGKTYTMSAWVKSDSPGLVQLIGGGDWQYRVAAPATGDSWRRIERTFRCEKRDCDFTFRINIEAPTTGVWVDDVKLEEGDHSTPDPVDGDNGVAALDAARPEIVVQGDGEFSLAFGLVCPRPVTGMVKAALSSGESLERPLTVAAGVWQLMVHGEANSAADTARNVAIQIEEGGKEIAAAKASLRFYSPTASLERLNALRKALPDLKKRLEKVKAAGRPIDYPQITFTVLDNFVNYVDEDSHRGEVRRAFEQLGELEAMAARLHKELDEALAGQRRFEAVPRWTADKRPTIHGSSFVGPVRLPDGTTAERPIFFTGYGHFGQVVNDMEKWPAYGINIIQIERGPSSVLPQKDVETDAPVRDMLKILDRAKRSGVAVCLLISPHYFPKWAMQQWPHLKKRRGGFLQYCLHAPEGQALLKQFIAALIVPLKDHPALHSICISNEPVNEEEPCEFAKIQWKAWLTKRHGDIAQLNAHYGSKYASFDDVPLPDPFGDRGETPRWMDFVRFNQEFFAGWHQMLAQAVHQAAPNLPVHAKAMSWTMVNDADVRYGADATLFGKLSDINGNDSCNNYDFGKGSFAQGWSPNAIDYTLQRSVLDAPVFNTENHLITDRDIRHVPPSHIRAALWQGALYGQSATTIWVWERAFDPKSDIYASIMHRPACAEAVGAVNCDLNRAALEMTALQQARPSFLLLHGLSNMVWDNGSQMTCLPRLFTALSFTGLKPGFITERQLEEGIVPETSVLFVPDLKHLSDAAFATLAKFKGRLVLVGDGDLLSHNEYGQTRKMNLQGDRLEFHGMNTGIRELHTQILARLSAWGLQPQVDLLDADGKPAWGVEWRIAETAEGLVVNVCNYRSDPTTVTLRRDNKDLPARDVLSGESLTGPFTLQPLEIRLLRSAAK